jgi:hypothetical protein
VNLLENRWAIPSSHGCFAWPVTVGFRVVRQRRIDFGLKIVNVRERNRFIGYAGRYCCIFDAATSNQGGAGAQRR